MRELAPQDELLKVRDLASIIVLPEDGWYCPHPSCEPTDLNGTVEWIKGPDGREFGRCRECGQKLALVDE